MAEDDEPSIGEDLARELAKAIRERDEAREQVRALTEQLAEAKLAGDLEHEGRMAAQEQVRSLTVERDEAKAWASSTAELHEQNLARLAHGSLRQAGPLGHLWGRPPRRPV